MRFPKFKFKYAALLLAITSSVLGAQAPGRQSGAESGSKDKSLQAKVPNFELKNQPLLDGLWLLAGGAAPFGFGFEKVLKKRQSDPDIIDPPLTLQLKEKSVSEILDVLCQADP